MQDYGGLREGDIKFFLAAGNFSGRDSVFYYTHTAACGAGPWKGGNDAKKMHLGNTFFTLPCYGTIVNTSQPGRGPRRRKEGSSMKRTVRKWLSLLMAFAIVLSLMPVALAEDENNPTPPSTEVTPSEPG